MQHGEHYSSELVIFKVSPRVAKSVARSKFLHKAFGQLILLPLVSPVAAVARISRAGGEVSRVVAMTVTNWTSALRGRLVMKATAAPTR